MKVLIITSENLYPGYTLGAIFELAQARILSEKFDVAILSVARGDSLIASVKGVIGKLFFLNRRQKTKAAMQRLTKAIGAVVFKKKVVAKYKIEGTDTYEGVPFAFASYGNFEKHLRVWMEAGNHAFEAYYNDNGKPDIIHAHGRFLNAGALALDIKKKYGIKYVYTDHSTFYKQGIAPVAAKPVLSDVIAQSSTYITVSEALEKEIAVFLQQPVRKANIIPNVIDPVFESPLHTVPAKKNNFTFITVAALEYKKGHDLLIAAFAAAFKNDPYYKLIITGDGPLRESLVSLSEQAGVSENINFTGILPKNEILTLLDNSDAMVLPSRIETFGVVIIEALSRGLPVISTRSGGPEFIINETCGILIEPGDVSALTEALSFLPDNIHRYKKDLIRACALKKYGSRNFLSAMESVYNSVAV